MKGRDYTIIIIAILALAVIIAYTVFRQDNTSKRNFTWMKTYQDGKTEPYDFGVMKALLEKNAGLDFNPVIENLEDKLEKHAALDSATYVFIGQRCYLNREEIDALLSFAETGHDVMFIAEGLPDTLMQALSYFAKPVLIDRFDEHTVNVETERAHSKIKNHRFNFRSFEHDTDKEVDWYFIDEKQQLDYFYGQTGNRYIRLGRINGKLNYARFKVGAGSVYIHTSPVLFTNYALRNDSGYLYADEVFSGLHTGHIIYDVYSRSFKEDSEEIKHKSDSPLSYILKQPSLKWAWSIFLFTVLLFFLFKAKRKQRIVPVLEQKRNTSLRFIDTLSDLFYHDANHRQMAETRMNLFLFFLRNKLSVSTHDINGDVLKLVALKSKVPESEIERIFDYYNKVIQNRTGAIDSAILMEFYNRVDRFYQLYYSKK